MGGGLSACKRYCYSYPVPEIANKADFNFNELVAILRITESGGKLSQLLLDLEASLQFYGAKLIDN